MIIRKHQTGEEIALWQLRFQTVHTVNARDYSHEQLVAWTPEHVDERQWSDRIAETQPFVCVVEDEIVGFADVQTDGYIDQFYVHHLWQGQGVGGRLYATLEAEARANECAQLYSNVSITARPFFAAKGFQVVSAQTVHIGLVALRNFRMTKSLCE